MNVVFEDVKNKLNLFDKSQSDGKGYTRVTMSPYFNRLDITNRYTKLINPPSVGIDVLGSPPANQYTVEFNYKLFPFRIYNNPKEFEGKYIIPVGVNRDPGFWSGMSKYSSLRVLNLPTDEWGHLFKLIKEEYLNDLKSKRAYLAIDTSLEGYHEHWVWDYFREGCKDYNIPLEQIIYISGNSIVEKDLERWKLENNNKKNVHAIGYPHFEWDMGNNKRNLEYEGKSLPTWLDHFKYKRENKDKIKTYNFLNRKPRMHRVWFYSILEEYNMLNKGLVSMNKATSNLIRIGDRELDPDYVHYLNQDLPKILFEKGNMEQDAGFYINRFHPEETKNSYVSIISEARFEDEENTVFLSEKTFKTIACSHPFIILGNKGSLKELRKLGYKTFHHAFHEGYDECENVERMYAILDLLKNIHSQPDKLNDFMHWTRHAVERNLEVLKFNTLYNPPVGFHFLLELLNEDICTINSEKDLI